MTIPGNTVGANGDYDLTITNPAPGDCSVVEVFSYTDPPTITSIDPPQICLDPTVGFTLDVFGTSFASSSVISVDGNPVPTTFISDTQLQGAVPAGLLGAGLYDVTVDNGGGGSCADTAFAVLEITQLPIVFFVEPPSCPT